MILAALGEILWLIFHLTWLLFQNKRNKMLNIKNDQMVVCGHQKRSQQGELTGTECSLQH